MISSCNDDDDIGVYVDTVDDAVDDDADDHYEKHSSRSSKNPYLSVPWSYELDKKAECGMDWRSVQTVG